jgi:hypothetical protein
MSDTETVIGKPVYGSNGGNARPNAANANWKIGNEGSHIYRILPPFGLLANAGRWSQYEAVHWGFSLSNGKKRAFRCIQRKNNRTKMVEIECPMCKRIAEQTKLRDDRKAKLEAEGKSPAEVAALLQPLNDWLACFNLQKGHYLNVMRPDGQIGRLFIKIRLKQALDAKLPVFMNKYKLDPIAAEDGMWLDFTRTGMGRNDTTYDVSPVEAPVEVNGRTLMDIKSAPLSADVIKRMAREAFELSTQFRDLTYDEVQMLVSSNGDPAIVDAVFGAPTTKATNNPSTPSFVEEEYEEVESDAAVTSATPSMDDDAEAAILAQLAALRAKKAPPKTVATTTEDDFVAQFKAGKL